MSSQIRHVAMTDPLVVPLLEDLEREYSGRYGFVYEDLKAYPPERFAPPDGVFLLLIEDGKAVAGGAFQRHSPGTAEVKRMWTHREHRRRGLAARVLSELEKEAVSRGYQRIRLDTGPRQPEATALYLTNSYTPLFDLDAPPTHGPLPFEKRLEGDVRVRSS